MKIKQIIIAAVGLALTFSANASPILNYFGMTNSIDSSAPTITSWPTNGLATNIITFNYTNGATVITNAYQPGYLTGKAQAIYNQEHIVFGVQGWLVNTGAACTVAFNLTTADTVGSPPTVGNAVPGINTNVFGANVNQNDFEIPAANWVLVPIPANTTNWFNYHTNLVMDVQGIWDNSDFIGIYQVTNNFAPGNSLQNPQGPAWINKKIIPSTWIGN